MNQPAVSVVLAAFNCEDTIEKTLESIRTQEGPSFELIVVDDGSTDATASVIEGALRGFPQTTVITNRQNEGLTKSLVRGCDRACGKYIARADAGDRFLPGRLLKQYELLERNASLGLISCGTRFVSAEAEPLYEIIQHPDDLALGLSRVGIESVRGPSHHGSTMFRRDIYTSVGGYRSVFRVAQDLDLWLRMSEVCEVRAMPEILYESAILPGSISVGRRQQQIATARAILEGAKRRRRGESEPSYGRLLDRSVAKHPLSARQSNARYEYFVAGCLANRDRDSAVRHFRKAWRYCPWNPRYALKYWLTRVS